MAVTNSQLEQYKSKRDFKVTPEPDGNSAQASPAHQFVIQKHDASHLHFDLRLEIDGVYKSWAVPKGPSHDPADKRLAVEVEDHPLDYGTFEGTIPAGEYGGGTVMVWDRGTFSCDTHPAEELKSGNLKITFRGERLQGKWALILMHAKEKEAVRNWLLISENHDQVGADSKNLVEKFQTSVKTGRTMPEIAAGAEPSKATLPVGAKTVPFPKIVNPELATLADTPPEGDHWLHEIKFDGYRILTFLVDGTATLLSRNGLDWTKRFQKLAKQLDQLPTKNCVMDGEVVILNEKGVSDFGALQDYAKKPQGDLTYFAFDLIYLDGNDLSGLPLTERKAFLHELLSRQQKIRFSEHIQGGGQAFFNAACHQGLEGIISKRADSRYRQTRTHDWLKIKCIQRQEFVVGGFTPPTGSRSSFGSLLLGYFNPENQLIYCGKVGSGFDEKSLASTFVELGKLQSKTSAFAIGPTGPDAKGVTYVNPTLVCEVEFMAWTQDGRLRHPVFKGFRSDKKAKEISKEMPIKPPTNSSTDPIVEGIKITHPDRMVFPDSGFTKLEVAKYMDEIAEWMLPHVAHRPLAILRCMEGQGHECFFQKNYTDSLPDSLFPIDLGDAKGIGLSSAEALVALAQYGALEIHPWGSCEEDIEHPDRIILDLDPGEGLTWPDVVEAAVEVRKVLEKLGLKSWAKTSGGKGIHVCLPIIPNLTWDAVKDFCHGIATLMEHTAPDRYLATMSKAKREHRIYVDYLRNARGATAVAAYSLRARTNGPVSVPVAWSELDSLSGSAHFDLRTTLERVKKARVDPWKDFFTTTQDLKPILEKVQETH